MTHPTDLSKRFLDLHRKGSPLLLANAWDRGTARLLASLGFEALATTSAGHAGTLGRRDGRVTRDEALAHAQEIAAATPLPVNADPSAASRSRPRASPRRSGSPARPASLAPPWRTRRETPAPPCIRPGSRPRASWRR